MAVFRGIFDGIAEEIPEDLAEPDRIGGEVMGGGQKIEGEVVVFGGDLRLTDIDGFAENGVGIGDLALEMRFAADEGGDVEEIGDQVGFEFDVAADQFEAGFHFMGEVGGAEEEMGFGQDGGAGGA